jgi:hypothetical protein
MLPPGFEFSQGSLQDYVDCPRRFQLKYVEAQPWPAVEVEPALEHETNNIRGQQFHRILERYYSGVPVELLEASIQDDLLRQWWRAFLEEPPLNLPEEICLAEVRLATRLAGQRLVGVFDLVTIEPGRRVVIVDWKTGRFRPSREQVEQRMQTLVYPFVFVESGDRLFGGPVDPARVTMVYWFAGGPGEPHVFHYDAFQHERCRLYLSSVVEEVLFLDGGDLWRLTADVERCRYCVYRSLCGRGVEAGSGVEGVDVVGVGWGSLVGLEY